VVFTEICEQYGNTHYDATTSFGDVTLYDAALYHKGLANTASTDRPVLALAFAASEMEATKRNYKGSLASDFPKADEELQKWKHFFASRIDEG